MHIDKIISIATQQRARLLKLPDILGVGAGPKISRGKQTSIHAVLIYVREKQPLDQLPRAERIPKRIEGAPTDVIEIGEATTRHADELEHRFINYAKVHRELSKRRFAAVPSTANDRDIGNIAVIEDDPAQSFIIAERQDVDWVGAYKKFRLTHGDNYEFVTFWSDFEVSCECGAFYCGLVNATKGINWSACIPQGRAGWGSKKLQGFMYFIRDDDAALLQEIGHHWGAYTGFKYKKSAKRTSYEICLGHQPGHWSSYFDDDASPMDYDESELKLPSGISVDWIDNGDGTFTRRRIGQGEYRFSKLDLYLMGLISPNEVGEFFFIKNPKPAGKSIRGTRVTLKIDNIMAANGKRTPTAGKSPKSFTNAFVLLTKDASKASSLAKKIDIVRQRYTDAFAAATGNLARVITTL
jgi:hypothetical protein